jgi:hypothetical protein
MARQPGNILALNWYKSRGLKAMIATATNTEGGMLFQPDERDKGLESSGISTIRSFIQLAAEKDISGMLCTAWDDKSPHMENYWRGFIASAEFSWSPEGRSLEEYDNAWLQREFGISMNDYLSINDQLRKGSELWYEAYYKKGNRLDDEAALQSMPRLEHWLPALPNQEKIQFDYTSKLIELPDLESPGTWSRKYKERLDRSIEEIENYKLINTKLSNNYNISLRNRYYWELAMTLHRFQNTAPRLLLALKSVDNTDKDQQKKGMEEVKRAVVEFRNAWAALESVYSRTRFVSYPSNYIPDRYFHLASQSEDLTWMIQPEILYLRMIEKWIGNQK